ncbi:TPA: hypothetical protein ACFP4U_000466 [Neisseria lactamica]|uniref:hypothetical protein n=1 Tax=Neisseria lactamica TaxID=486 RepID=UPI000BB5D4FA|nr:hypothetical protein [Neisseria lactamica]SUA15614.1 putative phage associated protein [Neisseria lactamica]
MDDKAEKQAGYQRKYEEKRVFKKVSFNIEKEADLLEIAKNIDFSQWVKEQIRKEFLK